MSKKPNLMSTQDDPEGGFQLQYKADGSKLFKVQLRASLSMASVDLIAGASSNSQAGVRLTPTSGRIIIGAGRLGGSDEVILQEVKEPLLRYAEPKEKDGPVNLAMIDPESHAAADWVERFSWFIPKEIREPWRGDLLEDRERMAGKGCSRVHIEWATAIQLLYLLISRLWARFGWAVLIYNRLTEWLIHNR